VKKVLVLLAISSGLIVSACNTVHGAAKDVKSAADCADGKPGNCWRPGASAARAWSASRRHRGDDNDRV